MEFWCYLLLRVITAVIIPLWLMAGLVSAGCLWPPQVREWLLVGKTTDEFKEAEKDSFSEVVALKKEIEGFKNTVRSQMKGDREEVKAFRAEAESFKKSMMADLSQVNEIMSTLLEMRRQAVGGHEI
mmetsp:Transcript_15768/g.23164  ORF Transcript_15768/g.23164 Transcript_15768/m.23164 type:complete len:127 (+) Transcript_15768:1883-2263(+)